MSNNYGYSKHPDFNRSQNPVYPRNHLNRPRGGFGFSPQSAGNRGLHNNRGFPPSRRGHVDGQPYNASPQARYAYPHSSSPRGRGVDVYSRQANIRHTSANKVSSNFDGIQTPHQTSGYNLGVRKNETPMPSSSREQARNVVNLDESDSDVLVIDISDQDDNAENPLANAKNGAVMSKSKRKRKRVSEDWTSGSDDEDYIVPKKKGNVAKKVEEKFELVEDALEAMFAGVSGDLNKKEAGKATITEASKPSKKKSSVKKLKQEPRKFADDISPPPSLLRKKKVGLTEQDHLLEKYRGPFVRVQGEVTSPYWCHVVNAATDPLNADEEKNRDKPIIEQKVRATGFGSHMTTLSSKYDVKKHDGSWICVFCKKPSHYKCLGDLFGPYFASKDVMNSIKHRSPSKADDIASQFIIGGTDKKKRRKKMSSTDHGAAPDLNNPLSPLHSNGTVNGVEVWFHEDCVCWMPSIRVLGHTILGIDDAVRQSHRETCSKCHLTGCTLGCVYMGCRETAHFLCAQQSNWRIDSENFHTFCSRHAGTS